ncbi:MAG TPA: hypothetical protein VHF89_12460 [Solirubrobacteraceae bacterium]|nr:hypothetical protein [Solirubrobacteraceae bacterium]
MKTKTVALAAVAALALPAAAQAGKPAEPGKQGRDTAAAKKQAQKPKGKAFTLKGTTAATALPVADGALTGPLTLDPTSANRHARILLTLSKADLRGTATETFGVTGDKVAVRYEGLAATDALQATDVVKVLGKVKGGELDIRSITVTRETAEPADS